MASQAGPSRRMYHRESYGIQSSSFLFNAAAYGIPKQRADRPKRKRDASPWHKRMMLAPLTDFLMGIPRPPASRGAQTDEADDERQLPSSLSYLHGKGLQSTIRYHGRIVKTRLRSKQVGEDAYFLKDDALGIADGVGGWASNAHADPALFSRLLMHFCYDELSKLDKLQHHAWAGDTSEALTEWFNCDPVEIMQVAWERCVRASKREGILGSATALLAVLRGDELRVANMGDCVLVLIRNKEMIFRSAEQQHSFNYPVQLGMMDATVESVTLASALCQHRDGMLPDGADDLALPDVNEKMSRYIHSYDANPENPQYDSPRHDAGIWGLKVQPGDLVIMASDGLFDNLFDDDILETVLSVMDGRGCSDLEHDPDLPHTMARALCDKARSIMEDPRGIVSPFQQHANEEGIYYVGGKNDDVTVLIGVVSEHEALGTDPYDVERPPTDA